MSSREHQGRVGIRIWRGAEVVAVITTDGPGSVTFLGSIGGASNSTSIDIELDPWAGLITDRRAQYPHPVYITEQPESGEEA